MLTCKNVLVLSPHTDDSELGAGGLIARLISEGARITVMVFSNPVKSLTHEFNRATLLKEFKNAAKLQKVNSIVLDYEVRYFPKHRQAILENIYSRRKNDYDLIVTPCSFDTHQDHRVIYEETCRAFRRTTVLGYELPWNHVNFSSPLYIKLAPEHIEKKWKALSCYTSQIKMKREYFTKEFIYGLAKVRGVQAGSEYAEMYQLIHGISC